MKYKKPYRLLIFLLLMILLTACKSEQKDVEKDLIDSERNDIEKDLTDGERNDSEKDLIASKKDDLFELRLYLDKGTYSTEENIFCYATLEYIGEEDSITVYSSDPLVGFGIKDDKYFDGGYAVNDILIQTSFQKGQIIRYDFTKSGGWDADHPYAKFYESYYSNPNLILPAGDYKVSATVNCSLDENNIQGTRYRQTVTANFKVQE